MTIPGAGGRASVFGCRGVLAVLLLTPAVGCAAGTGGESPTPTEAAAIQATLAATAPPVAADATAAATLAAVQDRLLASGTCDDACLAALRALWDAHPGDPALRVTLTNALIQRRDWSGIAAVVRALSRPSDADRLLLAKALIKLGAFDEAADVLAPLVDARPDDADLAYNAAFADYYGNRADQAGTVLDRAWGALSAAGDANAMTLRAMIHLEAGELDRAAEVAERVTALQPDFFPAWDALGRVRAARGDEAGAAEAFDRVDAINTANEAGKVRQMRLSAQATALKMAWRDRDLAEAKALVDAMLPEADAALQRQLYEYAVAIYEATGRPDLAEAARAAAERLPLAGEEAP